MSQSVLSQLSHDVAELVEGARGFVAGVRAPQGHGLSGVLWRPDAVVVSEQALPTRPISK